MRSERSAPTAPGASVPRMPVALARAGDPGNGTQLAGIISQSSAACSQALVPDCRVTGQPPGW